MFTLRDGEWHCAAEKIALTGKRPGLQGPIDDAFATPFLCVRGTGKPWHAQVGAWAESTLRRFEYEWARYMRGDLPVKNDTDITAEDLRTRHLILFGDPGSNTWIAKALPKLPLSWTQDEVALGAARYASDTHAPALICASPFAPDRYIVLNSGHTFHEKEFAAFNYLLFPRLGDWAILKAGANAEAWHPGAENFPEEAVRAGFFDEQWSKPLMTQP